MEKREEKIQKAKDGDIRAFQEMFVVFQDQLKSYLYRLMANRSEAEDIAHDTFIRAYEKLYTFDQRSSLKTWVFQIATNLAYNLLKKRKRWSVDVSEQAKSLVINDQSLSGKIESVNRNSHFGSYDIKEHIDTCFTCISKTLPVENQIALLLKDVYDFSVKDIILIIDKSEGQVKYNIQKARKSMEDIFDNRCALVNKKGICHQCSELNGWFNPKQNQQIALLKIKMVKDAKQKNKEELYKMRTALIKAINPLKSKGNELQEILLECNRLAMGESNMDV